MLVIAEKLSIMFESVPKNFKKRPARGLTIFTKQLISSLTGLLSWGLLLSLESDLILLKLADKHLNQAVPFDQGAGSFNWETYHMLD